MDDWTSWRLVFKSEKCNKENRTQIQLQEHTGLENIVIKKLSEYQLKGRETSDLWALDEGKVWNFTCGLSSNVFTMLTSISSAGKALPTSIEACEKINIYENRPKPRVSTICTVAWSRFCWYKRCVATNLMHENWSALRKLNLTLLF